ncbi:MAG: hypothetical protein M3R70_12800 [Actinomycetota bacterium]|nr:hypothetical protein [Actinomycetota bacterium]
MIPARWLFSGWRKPKHDLRSPREVSVREEVAPVKVRAVRGERIDLSFVVLPPKQSVAIPSARVTPHYNDVALSWRPLALDARQPRLHVEDQVVASTLCQRSVDVNAELGGGEANGHLRDRALLIGTEHTTSLVVTSDDIPSPT